MQSNMVHSFAQVPSASIPRSSFNRSCSRKTTLDAGYLVPIFCDEAVPGDTFNLKMQAFGRLATLIRPIMDNMVLDFFFFAVPNRLIWENWQKFMGERLNPEDSTDYLEPEMMPPSGGFPIGSLSDYFGIPTGVESMPVNSKFHRAYNLIWNEWFRDQNLQGQVPNPNGDGPDNQADFQLLKRGKRHDYFTSALPWPQKGDSVQIPLGAEAPVYGHALNAEVGGHIWQSRFTPSGAGIGRLHKGTGNTIDAQGAWTTGAGAATDAIALGTPLHYDSGNYEPPYADLSAATAASINQLRLAFQLQKMLERDARGGTRYTEILRSHFGVISPDARLQRPEYLGGFSQHINVTPIAQNSSTDETTPQGNLAGIGTISAGGRGFIKSFVEHSLIIGMVCLRADLNYQQGLNKMFSRRTRYDYYWPSLSHIGEQAVLNKEIYAQGNDVVDPSDNIAYDEKVFGYQERYAEYRYKPSEVTGLFRSQAAQSLDSWHLAQEFDGLPALNADFIEEQPPVDRIIAVPSQPHLILDLFFSYRCARPMPVYSVPGLIDHF